MLNKKFNEFYEEIKPYKAGVDLAKVKKAWEFAALAHTGQKRLSGEPYVLHPLEVAKILNLWKLDADSIVAGLLHDTIEDGGATRNDLVVEFGEEVATLVDGVSKVATIRWQHDIEEQFAENLRKMILFMAQDIRVVIVKLADRLHNMRTLWAVKHEKQERIARETLEIYAPLAERLGMGEVSGELSDLAFEYCYPKEFKKIIAESKPYYKTTGSHIKKMRHILLRRLGEANINADVKGREKRLYSLWRKLQRKNLGNDFDQIHDIVALRILVDTVPQCYAGLGIIHSYFKPVPNLGISDFIAQPKPNGYQSIHTKVFGPAGRIVEVQIRTRQMHELAEYGVAAHWAYSQAKAGGTADDILEKKGVEVKAEKLSWVKQLVEWQKELTDSKEYLEAVKFDAFRERNFVFSPKGDVFDLPNGATVVDFAFSVHTSLAGFIQGAKVNGKIVPLNYKLQGGDVVGILKSKNKKPLNRDWLRFVVTTAAKREISKQLRNSE